MAMFDRVWLPNPPLEHHFHWKAASAPMKIERTSALVGFPQSINAEMVWKGVEFQEQPGLYRYELDERHIEELEDAAAEVEGNPVHFCIGCFVKGD
jgi:hypothetical protein